MLIRRSLLTVILSSSAALAQSAPDQTAPTQSFPDLRAQAQNVSKALNSPIGGGSLAVGGGLISILSFKSAFKRPQSEDLQRAVGKVEEIKAQLKAQSPLLAQRRAEFQEARAQYDEIVNSHSALKDLTAHIERVKNPRVMEALSKADADPYALTRRLEITKQHLQESTGSYESLIAEKTENLRVARANLEQAQEMTSQVQRDLEIELRDAEFLQQSRYGALVRAARPGKIFKLASGLAFGFFAADGIYIFVKNEVAPRLATASEQNQVLDAVEQSVQAK